MACIRARKRKDGSVSYQAIVRIAGQPAIRETFSDRNKARAWGDAMSAAARASVGQMPDTNAFKKMSLLTALTEWGKDSACPRTYTVMIETVKKFIGSVTLGHVTKDYVGAYIDKLRLTKSQYNRTYSDVTILKHLSVLRGAARHAAEKFRVTPDLGVFSVKGIEGAWKTERTRVLTPDEELKLRATIPSRTYEEPWSLLIDLAIETFARESELVLMELAEVDFDNRVWTIPKEHTKKKYAREVSLSKKATGIVIRLRDLLEKHNEKRGKDPESNAPETRLFHCFATPSSVCTGFAKLTKAAGINDFHFHDLRHTGITRATLKKRGLKVEEIMKIAGHKSYGMYTRYANIRGSDLVDRME